jgi:dipeptidase D
LGYGAKKMRALSPVLFALILGCAHASSPQTEALTSMCAEPTQFANPKVFLKACAHARVIDLTRDLVQFETVSADGPVHENPQFLSMAAYLSKWAKKNGIDFQTHGKHDVWVLSYGKGPLTLGLLMHADVVPVNQSQWTVPAFTTGVKNGRLYGRGTEDDKGPIAAAMLVFETLSAFKIKPAGTLQIVLGTGEEHDWDGMVAYAKSKPQPKHMISVDASYPVVIAESGFVAWHLGVKKTSLARVSQRARIDHLTAGNFLTQVPQKAQMVLIPGRAETRAALRKRVSQVMIEKIAKHGTEFSGTVTATTGGVLVTATGKAVHSSTSEDGANALWLLASVAQGLNLVNNAGDIMLKLVNTHLSTHYGESLKLAYDHDVMGRLTVIPSLLREEDGHVKLSINMRRPAGKTVEEFQQSLDQALEQIQGEISPRIKSVKKAYVGAPALAKTEGNLVPTLIEIYRKHTKDMVAKPVSIRGGTYARLFEGAVSFGPSMPKKEYRGHAPDEYIEIEILHRMVHMLYEATERLGLSSD